MKKIPRETLNVKPQWKHFPSPVGERILSASPAGDAKGRSEAKRRLKRAIDAPPGLLRDYLRRIQDRQLLTIERVREDAVAGIRQILETQGAEVFVE